MRVSLAYRLDVSAPHIPRVLVPPDASRRLREIAQSLPASIAEGMLLECRLHDDDQVDLSVGLNRAHCHEVLHGAPSETGLASRFFGTPEWRSIRMFAAAWNHPALRLHSAVTQICFEFDGDTSDWDVPIPSLFVRLAQRDTSISSGRIEHRRDVRAALTHLLPASEAAAIHPMLSQCLHVLTPGASISWLARMLPRGHTGVRICISGLPIAAIGAYLDLMGWTESGDRIDQEIIILGIRETNTNVTLAFDIEQHVGARVGLELRPNEASLPRVGSKNLKSPYGPLLDRLVEFGLCTKEKRDAATAWHRVHRTRGFRSHAAAMFFHCELIKLVCRPGRPWRAKIYPAILQKDLMPTSTQ